MDPSGAKRWAFIFRWRLPGQEGAGKLREMGLGSIAAFSLGEARDKARDARALVAKLRPNGVPRPGVQAKLEHVYGREATDSILSKVKAERAARNAEDRFAGGGGSITMPATAAAAGHDAESGMHVIKSLASGSLGGAVVGAAAGGALGGAYGDHNGLGGAVKGALAGAAMRRGAGAMEDVGMAYRDQLGRLLTMTPAALRDELASFGASRAPAVAAAPRRALAPAMSATLATSDQRQ